MPPTFSKLAVMATPGVATVSGLRCGHADCHALFLSIEESEEHALKNHSGKAIAVTCDIRETNEESGRVVLCRVMDGCGEEALENRE